MNAAQRSERRLHKSVGQAFQPDSGNLIAAVSLERLTYKFGVCCACGLVAFVLVGCSQSQTPVEAPLTVEAPAAAGDDQVLRVLDSYNPVYKLNADGRITDLLLQGKHVLPPVMVEVGKLTALERLNLVGASLTDDSLSHLAGLTRLKILRLGSTPIGDQGLLHLEKLQNLVHVYVPSNKVTPAGTKRLRAALPQLTVHEK